MQRISTCRVCAGRGRLIDHPCPECGGRGEAEREERLTVAIPSGAEEGLALRVPGRGEPSREPAGTPGDLYVIVRTAPDPRFERNGADLWRTEMLAVPDAVLGTTLKVPTLEAPVELRVPAGTQPDAVLRVRGKGLPHFGTKRRGDLHIRVQVAVPQRLSAAERSLYERLRAQSRSARGAV
jgi:molecular chaperone DnaJ